MSDLLVKIVKKHKTPLLASVVIIIGIIILCVYTNQDEFIGTQLKSDDCYKLEFEQMNTDDTHTFSATKNDILAVDYNVEKGYVDLYIKKAGSATDTIYKGNGIDKASFEVILPENGDYEITVVARHAAGYININLSR